MELIDQFDEQLECEYKGERYLVRDNGAVLRLPKDGQKPRPLDNKWTFGTPDKVSKYMSVSSAKVHIIVATAFYGPKDSKVYVVDHIDTNRCNNRKENLRWLTRLENILLNNSTRAKIEYICGSVENFLANPELLRGHEAKDSNFAWMRTVSKEEAANTRAHWKELSAHPRPKKETTDPIGGWIYDPLSTPLAKELEEERQKKAELEEKRKADAKALKEIQKKQRQEAAEALERENAEKSARICDSIVACADEYGWEVISPAKGKKWQADLLITSGDEKVAVKFFGSNRKCVGERKSMSEDGIRGLWLGTNGGWYDVPTISDLKTRDNEDYVVLDDDVLIPAVDFVKAFVEQRLVREDAIHTTAIKVRFISERCYNCGTGHNIYLPLGYYEGDTFYCSGNIDMFDSLVVDSVKKYVASLPENRYRIGPIKERKYMSFGCPECDFMVGNHYVNEAFFDYIYEEDDEDVHKVELTHPMVVPYEHWVIKSC